MIPASIALTQLYILQFSLQPLLIMKEGWWFCQRIKIITENRGNISICRIVKMSDKSFFLLRPMK